MKSRNLLLLTALATAIAAGGCEQKKSSNPLSPSVAGPIPGVAITAPKLSNRRPANESKRPHSQ